MPTVNTDFKLSGEREYKQALSNINEGLKVLNSEMKLTKSEYADNADSIDALNAKNDVLERKILSQKEKIEVLRKALQDSAEAYGESDKKTMEWQISLNNAEAELNSLNNELDANKEQMKKTNEGFTSLGDVVDMAAGKLGINLPSGANKAIGSLGKVSASTVAVVGGVAAIIAILVKLEKTFINLSKEAAAFADNVATLSQITSLSTDTLQEFMYATELIDVPIDTVRDSLKELVNKMKEAKAGTGDAADAFNALGIVVTKENGELRSAEEIFYDTIDALGEMENATERDALALKIFGESGQRLNPIIVQGTERFRELAQEAHKTGYVLSTEDVEALVKVSDATERLTKTTEGLKNQIGAEFAPATEEALTMTKEGIEKIGKAFLESGATDNFASILDSAINLIDPLTELTVSVLPLLNSGLSVTADICALIADTAQVITGLLTLDFGRVKQYLGLSSNEGLYSNQYKRMMQNKGYSYDSYSNSYYNPNVLTGSQIESAYKQALEDGSAVGKSYEVWLEEYQNKYFGRNSSGDQNWRGGLTWVGENGRELVALPQGSQIMNASESRDVGNTYYYITIDAKNIEELNDIVRMAEEARWIGRM